MLSGPPTYRTVPPILCPAHRTESHVNISSHVYEAGHHNGSCSTLFIDRLSLRSHEWKETVPPFRLFSQNFCETNKKVTHTAVLSFYRHPLYFLMGFITLLLFTETLVILALLKGKHIFIMPPYIHILKLLTSYTWWGVWTRISFLSCFLLSFFAFGVLVPSKVEHLPNFSCLPKHIGTGQLVLGPNSLSVSYWCQGRWWSAEFCNRSLKNHSKDWKLKRKTYKNSQMEVCIN